MAYSWISRGHLAAIVAAVACGFCCNTTQAAFTSVSSRAALAGTDFIDWSAVGPDYTSPTNPFNIDSNGGLTATVSQASGNAQRRTQGPSMHSNFALNDAVLWLDGNNSPLTIMFGTAVTTAGTQIAARWAGVFTGQIEALAADGTTVLTTINYSGNTTNAGDNSAVFVGIAATGGDQFNGIRITGLTASNSPKDFAINQVDFTPAPAAVPVPAGMVLMLTGLPVLGFAGWTRRRVAIA